MAAAVGAVEVEVEVEAEHMVQTQIARSPRPPSE